MKTVITKFGAVCAALAVAAAALASPASADNGIPYSDPNANGSLTLCNTSGQPVTHGNIHTKPFVWRAVGSNPGPVQYQKASQHTAALYGYQPIQSVDPYLWSGEYLTASARYTNAVLPMAGATAGDPTLADLLNDYPTKWDGLIELRMFLGAPDMPARTMPYNAATLRVSGDTWTLLDGGNASCRSGDAFSNELVLPAVRALGTPAPNATTTGAGPGRSTSRAAKSGSSTAASTSLSADSSSDSPSAVAGARRGSGGSSLTWLWIVLGIGVAGAGVIAWRMRGRPQRSG